MSPLDAVAELREARPVAPPELRERVRAVAASVPEPGRRRATWRRAALVLVPVVLAAAVGAALVGRGGEERASVRSAPAADSAQVQHGAAAKSFGPATASAPAPSRTRLQDYDATLRLRVRDAQALSDATKRAVRIARALGGFASAVSVEVDGREGDASLRLRVPATKVQAAVERLSALGTITGESVSVQDVQPQVNALDRKIARLQRDLARLRADASTPARRLEQLTAQVEKLQRARAAEVRQARLATVELQLTTRAAAAAPAPAEDGPLHGALAALRLLGIGALYALVVGGPVALAAAAGWLAWRLRRRLAERRLLGRV